MNLTENVEKLQSVEAPAAPAVRYYLLNDALCVVNDGTDAQNGDTCASFFDLFPTKRAVREEIADYLRSFPCEMLLTRCGRTPVLFVGTLMPHTGLVLAVLPEGEIKGTLAFPAAFHHVPSCACVSPSAQMYYKAHDEERFAAACRWLLRVGAPFTPGKEAELGAELSRCARLLSQLLDVPLAADLSGLLARSLEGIDERFAIGVLLATLAAAAREGDGGSVQLYAATEGVPTLYLSYDRVGAAATVPEFLPLLRCAEARGMALDVACPLADPHRVQVRASLGIAELSLQGVRERHRFLEGKSPLGSSHAAHAVPISFPELFLDLS
jgi:hypothetical protein